MRTKLIFFIFLLGLTFGVGGETIEKFYLSNHDQSPCHRVIHSIVGQTNVIYDAQGALEEIRGEAIAFLIRDSENVILRNVRIDWFRPCMTEARIVAFDRGETVVSIDQNRFPVTVRDRRLLMVGEGWTNEVFSATLFRGGTHEQIARAGDIFYRGFAYERPDGTFSLLFDFSSSGEGAEVGDVVVLRPKHRPNPAIVVYDSKNTVLEDVIVHDAYGMALIAQRAENVTWRGTKTVEDKVSGVFPRSGSYASTHADASHFSNVKGKVVVENCWFEGMMDDAINVHSTCLSITNIIAPNRFVVRYMHHQAFGFGVFRTGDRLRFVRGRTLENGPECRIVGVKNLNERDVELTLAERIPNGWGVGDVVENADYQCEVVFRGNMVCNNRARGSLFTTPRPVLIESNRFVRVTGSAILFAGDAYYWYESGACQDVLIRGNVFSNCCTAASKYGYSQGLISFYPIVADLDAQTRYYHKNISIEDNEIYSFDIPFLYATSVEDFRWRNNRVHLNDDYYGWRQPRFILRRCHNMQIDEKDK